MRQLRIGDITIDAVIEREGPWRRPQDFFPAYDEAVFKRHLPTMEPEVFDSALGMFDFPGKERWRNELFALGIPFDKVDYVFCTHLHIDHTGWNTTLRDGRWVPTFPNAKYIFHKREYAAWEAEHARGANPPGTVFRDNCLPVVEAGQALLVDDDYALDDTITLTPTPGHSPCHCCLNIFSRGQRAVVTGRLGRKAGGGLAPQVFIHCGGHRYAYPADPFPDTDFGSGHGGRGSIRLPVQARLSCNATVTARTSRGMTS